MYGCLLYGSRAAAVCTCVGVCMCESVCMGVFAHPGVFWLKALPMHSCMRAVQLPLPLPLGLATQFMYVRNMAPHLNFTFGALQSLLLCVSVCVCLSDFLLVASSIEMHIV